MKVYKNVAVPAVEAKVVKQLDKVVCDLCKKEGTEYSSYTNNWSTDEEKVDLVTIKYEDGWNWSKDNGGNEDGNVYYFDICNDCFKSKLQPYLESLGASCHKGLR